MKIQNFHCRFIKHKIILIISKLIVNKPLKPSIKLAPLITKNKHNTQILMRKDGYLLRLIKKVYQYWKF